MGRDPGDPTDGPAPDPGRADERRPDHDAGPPDDPRRWQLRLYVAGTSRNSQHALENLRRICEERLAGRYELEVIDLLEHPQLAAEHQILAVPTLVRKMPQPLRKIIGDLSSTEKVLVGLDLRPMEE